MPDQDADIAIASLALAARRAELFNHDEDLAKEIRDRIRTPEIRQFIEEAGIKIRDTSAKTILAQIEQIPSAERKLFFLRRWCAQNRRRKDAADVVEAAFSIAVKATEYTPNARDVRELSTPLPYVDSKETLKSLISQVTANRANVEKYGPTIDYFRFQVNVARAIYSYDQAFGKTEFEDIYFKASELNDLAIRAECLAWLLISSFHEKLYNRGSAHTTLLAPGAPPRH